MLVILTGHNRPGEMVLRPRIVPARGRPGNICAPCCQALPAAMRIRPTSVLSRLKIPRMDVASLSEVARFFTSFHGAAASSYLSLRGAALHKKCKSHLLQKL